MSFQRFLSCVFETANNYKDTRSSLITWNSSGSSSSSAQGARDTTPDTRPLPQHFVRKRACSLSSRDQETSTVEAAVGAGCQHGISIVSATMLK